MRLLSILFLLLMGIRGFVIDVHGFQILIVIFWPLWEVRFNKPQAIYQCRARLP